MRKRIANRCKRAGALALATVMLAGALALPASAAADAAYTERLTELCEQEWSAPVAFRQAMQQLMQEHPDSPEPYYLYAFNLWYSKVAREEAVSEAEQEEALSYLNTAIELALRADHPYQSRWSYGEYDTPWELGEEPDYATLASRARVEILASMPGRQAELNEAMQQYLDCSDRGARIKLKDIEQDEALYLQRELAYGESGEQARQYAAQSMEDDRSYYTTCLNEEIPESRAELARIRAWTGTGTTSFEVHAGDEVNRITIAEDRESIREENNWNTRVWVTSKPIQSIQRTLDGVVVFVPAGTAVKLQDNRGEGHIVKKGTLFDRMDVIFVGI